MTNPAPNATQNDISRLERQIDELRERVQASESDITRLTDVISRLMDKLLT